MKIPFIINGELIEREECTENIVFKDKTVEVITPELSDSDFEKIKENRNIDILHDVTAEEIIAFFQKARAEWKEGNKYYDLALENIAESTGYSKEMVKLSLSQIDMMLSREYIELLLETELGSKDIMDNWIKRGDALVHCQPKGTILHVLAGNAPPVSIVSLLRGVISKNYNILKMASQDLVTLSSFVQLLISLDKNHPIVKSMSVVYWPNTNHDMLAKMVGISDVICAWGGHDAIETVKSHARDKEILIFGPRRGIQFIGKEVFSEDKLVEAAQKAAHDLVVFDQEACFSPQIAFVEGDKEKVYEYAGALEKALDAETEKFPKGKMNLQQIASISHARMCSSFLGNRLFNSAKMDYTIIVTENVQHTKSHPLGRTLFIIPVANLEEAMPYLSHETQVVAIEPFERSTELREQLTRKGVDRITNLGTMPYFSPGAPHDGMYPISRLVRWVTSR